MVVIVFATFPRQPDARLFEVPGAGTTRNVHCFVPGKFFSDVYSRIRGIVPGTRYLAKNCHRQPLGGARPSAGGGLRRSSGDPLSETWLPREDAYRCCTKQLAGGELATCPRCRARERKAKEPGSIIL